MLQNIMVTAIPLVIGALVTVSKDLEENVEELDSRGKLKTIGEIGKNTEKSPKDLKRLLI